MTRTAFSKEKSYDAVQINGKPYLYSDDRIDPDTVPEGLFIYEIADGDGDGCFARIQKHVLVNFTGTLIGQDEIPLDESGKYSPEYGSWEYEGIFGKRITEEEYLAGVKEENLPHLDGLCFLEEGKTYAIHMSALRFEKKKFLETLNDSEWSPFEILAVGVLGTDPEGKLSQIDVIVTIHVPYGIRTAEVADQMSYILDDEIELFESEDAVEFFVPTEDTKWRWM